MARFSKLVKPRDQRLIRLQVLRTQRLSPHWMRLTLGGGEIAHFEPLGFDQWFRLFLPLGGDDGLERLPEKANKIFGYMKYLRIPDGVRPVMRNYSVRAYRGATDASGPEIDVDFVLHGEGEHAGPASRWVAVAQPGESVVIIDEGLGFNPAIGVDRVLLVADETGLPAVSSIAESLPAHATGLAIIEVPTADDALPFEAPAGLEVRFIARDDEHAVPGARALAELESRIGGLELDGGHSFIVGEQALPTSARRLLVAAGADKERISFVGYWRTGTASPTPKSQRAAAH